MKRALLQLGLRWQSPLRLTVNGVERDFETLQPGSTVAALVAELGFRLDRVALEQNGNIVPRARWSGTPVHEADRLEVVHFVGGGATGKPVAPVSASSSDTHRLP